MNSEWHYSVLKGTLSYAEKTRKSVLAVHDDNGYMYINYWLNYIFMKNYSNNYVFFKTIYEKLKEYHSDFDNGNILRDKIYDITNEAL
ncbi:hypothetical protein POWCR01_000034200 [Plasmodium ovale]|uniref:Uncharacterized protein n=1 Tax=Plasmodium ovale TaxID=36330 RepID=A0A1C3KFZ9_PLAOA|nr:hypothetical protein POWCR01_000034200 [Plasmodium ovale]